jgi:hypothetical protein
MREVGPTGFGSSPEGRQANQPPADAVRIPSGFFTVDADLQHLAGDAPMRHRLTPLMLRQGSCG